MGLEKNPVRPEPLCETPLRHWLNQAAAPPPGEHGASSLSTLLSRSGDVRKSVLNDQIHDMCTMFCQHLPRQVQQALPVRRRGTGGAVARWNRTPVLSSSRVLLRGWPVMGHANCLRRMPPCTPPRRT